MSLLKRHPLVLAVVGIILVSSVAAVGANFLIQRMPISSALRQLVGGRTVRVVGSAMSPTLKDGQIVVVDKTAYAHHSPQLGDIVLIVPPDAGSQLFIKRVIAIPGDRLRITSGVVYINGRPISEPYLPEQWIDNNSWPATGQDQLVGPNEYFVMGDNRNHSTDSRSFGFVPLASIRGRITL